MKRKSIAIIGVGVLLSIFLFIGVAHAQSVKSGDLVTVSKNQTVDSMLFASGRTIVIEGTVNGDVFCAGQNVSISGTVNGDVFCAAQTLRITGEIDGSVRAAGQTISYGANTQGSVSLAGQVVTLDEDSIVGRDLLIGSNSTTLQGSVIRDASIGSETATINGEIGRNLGGQYKTLILGPSAVIKGSVDYTSNNNLNKNSSSKVSGQINRRDIPKKQNKHAFSFFGVFGFFIYLCVSLLIVSLTLSLLFPGLFAKTNELIDKSKSRTFASGLAMLVVVPLIIFLLALSLVGIPLAGLLFAAWAIAGMLSGPTVAYYVGSRLIHKDHKPFAIMLTGSAVVLALYLVPFINLIVAFCVGTFGTGALVTVLFTVSTSKKVPK